MSLSEKDNMDNNEGTFGPEEVHHWDEAKLEQARRLLVKRETGPSEQAVAAAYQAWEPVPYEFDLDAALAAAYPVIVAEIAEALRAGGGRLGDGKEPFGPAADFIERELL